MVWLTIGYKNGDRCVKSKLGMKNKFLIKICARNADQQVFFSSILGGDLEGK